jgi:OOP family OmpA-OmpF porin
VIDRLTIHVNFDFDKSVIRKVDLAELKKAVEFVRKYPGSKVQVEGHTDGIGTEQYNQKLSERRAEAVRQYLIKEGGVEPGNISAIGYGKTKPVADNKTKEGRAENRRDEILILSE